MKNYVLYLIALLVIGNAFAQLPDREIICTKYDELTRFNLPEAATGKINFLIFADDFRSWRMSGRPYHPDQFAYNRPSGLRVINTCGQEIADKDIPGSRYTDFVWSHSGKYLIFGIYVNGIFRLDVETGELVEVINSETSLLNQNRRKKTIKFVAT